MFFNVDYINGIIATMEKRLLKDKLYRMCEQTADDAFRTLTESGFGAGAQNDNGRFGYEALIAYEEDALDSFIREYAPTKAEKAYLLAPRDFHNAKAILKANYLGVSPESMLGPDGLVPAAELIKCITEGDISSLDKHLQQAISESKDILSKEEGNPSGADIGVTFERALYKYLAANVKFGLLKNALIQRADTLNILTAFRAKDIKSAERSFVDGGKVTKAQLGVIMQSGGEDACKAFALTPYKEIVEECVNCKQAGKPFTEVERAMASIERRALDERKYDLERTLPFLYYCFRKRAENADVRVIFVCLSAGMAEAQIKKRLRAV